MIEVKITLIIKYGFSLNLKKLIQALFFDLLLGKWSKSKIYMKNMILNVFHTSEQYFLPCWQDRISIQKSCIYVLINPSISIQNIWVGVVSDVNPWTHPQPLNWFHNKYRDTNPMVLPLGTKHREEIYYSKSSAWHSHEK